MGYMPRGGAGGVPSLGWQVDPEALENRGAALLAVAHRVIQVMLHRHSSVGWRMRVENIDRSPRQN